jgi:hypothetical protein
MTDHAPYLHAVAAHLDKAGFVALSGAVYTKPTRSGHIQLGCQDGWDHYDRGDADLTWDEQRGWRIRWGGLTDDLPVPTLATPAVVAMAVGHHVRQTPLPVDGESFDSPRAEPGTPEFEAALAAYDTERTPR